MKTDRCKKPGRFRYISFGDVHLGHRGTPTALILTNLNKLITDDVLREVDMVIITGDLFDRQLNNGDDAVNMIQRWMSMLLYRCAAYGTMLRVVEGTPSHDRLQSQYFVEQKINANIDVDLHYAKSLSIEYIERLDSYFLYVPDKHNPSTDVTLREVKEQMDALGIKQVDFAIMHGAFSYQLPAIVPEPTHKEEEYLALVKHQILIGHVHIMTVRDRIFAAGSTDRICHGDEIPKGMFMITAYEDETWESVFIENKWAKAYITLEVHGFDTKQLNHAIRECIKNLPKGSAVRLRCDPHDVASADLETYRLEYPWIEWSSLVEKTTKKKNSVVESLKTFDMSAFKAITKDSIKELLAKELERFSDSPEQRERCMNRLEEYVTL